MRASSIHAYERAFLSVSAGVLALFFATLLYTFFAMNIRMPTMAGIVDPRTVYRTAPFDHPGLRQLGPGRYEAVIVGQAWAFVPNEIRVPRGATVTFHASSADVIHGFHVVGTRVNVMLIPGQLSEETYTFTRPGTYLLECHEYCGIGHHTMSGRIIVQ